MPSVIETPERLEVRESPLLLRAAAIWLGCVGAFFAAGAIGHLDQVSPPEGGTRWGIGLIGLGAMFCAPLVWRRAPDRRVTVDARLRTVRITERDGRVPAEWTLGFDEIDGIEIEVGKDDENYTVYRPVFRLGGASLPLRRSWWSDRERSENLAARARELLKRTD